jgi:hypothetical protein
MVPRDAWSYVDSLAPTIDYYGASIAYSGTLNAQVLGTPEFRNPFKDSPRAFTRADGDNPIIYTVAAPDGSTQDYSVIVSQEPEVISNVSVSFIGISDAKGLFTYDFDKETGLIKVVIDTSLGYSPPYDWYLDGREYPASFEETTLFIETKDLYEGQHELVLVVTKDGRSYTNKLLFRVDK